MQDEPFFRYMIAGLDLGNSGDRDSDDFAPPPRTTTDAEQALAKATGAAGSSSSSSTNDPAAAAAAAAAAGQPPHPFLSLRRKLTHYIKRRWELKKSLAT